MRICQANQLSSWYTWLPANKHVLERCILKMKAGWRWAGLPASLELWGHWLLWCFKVRSWSAGTAVYPITMQKSLCCALTDFLCLLCSSSCGSEQHSSTDDPTSSQLKIDSMSPAVTSFKWEHWVPTPQKEDGVSPSGSVTSEASWQPGHSLSASLFPCYPTAATRELNILFGASCTKSEVWRAMQSEVAFFT